MFNQWDWCYLQSFDHKNYLKRLFMKFLGSLSQIFLCCYPICNEALNQVARNSITLIFWTQWYKVQSRNYDGNNYWLCPILKMLNFACSRQWHNKFHYYVINLIIETSTDCHGCKQKGKSISPKSHGKLHREVKDLSCALAFLCCFTRSKLARG